MSVEDIRAQIDAVALDETAQIAIVAILRAQLYHPRKLLAAEG